MAPPRCLGGGLLWSMVLVVMSTAVAGSGPRPIPPVGVSRPPADRYSNQLAPVDAATVQAMRDFLQARSSAPITNVNVWRLPEQTYIVEVQANVGERWGLRALAQRLAVTLASACFASQWPLAEARITIGTNRFSLLTLNLGRNQAERVLSRQSRGIDSLFRDLKKLHNIEGHPADRVWVIERFSTSAAF